MNITLYGSASDRIDRAYIDGVEAEEYFSSLNEYYS